MEPIISFKADLWLWSGGKASWHFITVPKEYYTLIKGFAIEGSGFGSVPVKVTIGDTTWKTSVFPDSKRKTYILPVKKVVRTKEKIVVGATISVTIQIL